MHIFIKTGLTQAVISSQICRLYWLLPETGQNIRYSGVNCALGPSKYFPYSGAVSLRGEGAVRYSRVRFHLFYYNSAGLWDVFVFNGVFVIPGGVPLYDQKENFFLQEIPKGQKGRGFASSCSLAIKYQHWRRCFCWLYYLLIRIKKTVF